MLFYEPKLLKSMFRRRRPRRSFRFSALLRAEIVEIHAAQPTAAGTSRFSALLRAEIVEMGVQ